MTTKTYDLAVGGPIYTPGDNTAQAVTLANHNVPDAVGGGPTGNPVMALTQAEYDALDPKDPDTVYVIPEE